MLPLEIVGEIILQTGGIPLLRLISGKINKLYINMIEEYNMITKPITIEEMGKYLVNDPKNIYRFNYDNNKIVAKPLRLNINNYCPQAAIIADAGLTFGAFREYSCQGCKLSCVTEDKMNNYDLLTTYNIINNKTNDKQLTQKVIIDTFEYYCRLLKNHSLWAYLYTNCQFFNLYKGGITSDSYREKDIITWKNEILDKLKHLYEYDGTYRNHTNYIIPRIQ